MVMLSDMSAFVHQLNSLLQTLVLSVSLSVRLPGPCSLSLLHSSIYSLFTPQAKSEVAILINLPASLQLTSGQPHLKLHSLLLNQAGETEIEAGKQRKQEGDGQIVGWRGKTVIMGDGEGNKKKKSRETTTGNKKSKKGREKERFDSVWLNEKRTKETDYRGRESIRELRSG